MLKTFNDAHASKTPSICPIKKNEKNQENDKNKTNEMKIARRNSHWRRLRANTCEYDLIKAIQRENVFFFIH